MNFRSIIRWAFPLAMLLAGCNSFATRFAMRSLEDLTVPAVRLDSTITSPVRDDPVLSVLWIGHSSFLLQIHDKVIVTDPVFTKTVGLVVKRAVEPGVDPENISRVDATLISHLHFDHFNYASVGMLPKGGVLVIPPGGADYTPDFGFRRTVELRWWQSLDDEGMRITSVPVQHFGGRYAFDIAWTPVPAYCGYVVEYRGITIFIGGDTAYNPDIFREIGRRFRIDLALIPIGPVPRGGSMRRVHADPADAVHIFKDLGASVMVPMHYATFYQGFDVTESEAVRMLDSVAVANGVEGRVVPLKIGEQREFGSFVHRGG